MSLAATAGNSQDQGQIPYFEPVYSIHALNVKSRLAQAELQGEQQALIAAFYEARGFEPFWLEDGVFSEAAFSLLDKLAHANALGLNGEDYKLKDLRDGIHPRSAEDLAKLDIALTRAYSDFSEDLLNGRIDPRMDLPDELRAKRKKNHASALARIATSSAPADHVSRLPDDNFVVERMLPALTRYRALAATGGWEKIELSDTLHPGDESPVVPALKKRLEAEGYDVPEAGEIVVASNADILAVPENLYEGGIVEAVKEFQRRHGIAVDGVIGPTTLAELNVTAEERARQIEINIERARWLPNALGERFIFVNIAGYFVGLYDGEREADRVRAVVGKAYSKTPVFAEMMTYLVVNPYWNLPYSIVRDETAPAVRKNPNYLAEKNMEVVAGWGPDAQIIPASNIDWHDLDDNPPFRVRQRPGKSNSLGLIKFMFPNEYNVYLHDTPIEHLFDRPQRAFSHGCIRLGDPLAVADFVLRDTEGWDRARVEQQIALGEREVVSLDHKLPVYLTYLTVWVEADGELVFFPDVYSRDESLKKAVSPAI